MYCTVLVWFKPLYCKMINICISTFFYYARNILYRLCLFLDRFWINMFKLNKKIHSSANINNLTSIFPDYIQVNGKVMQSLFHFSHQGGATIGQPCWGVDNMMLYPSNTFTELVCTYTVKSVWLQVYTLKFQSSLHKYLNFLTHTFPVR